MVVLQRMFFFFFFSQMFDNFNLGPECFLEISILST